MDATIPSCNLPLNYTGQWFTSEDLDSDVIVNQTHMIYKTKLDEYTTRETFYTCKQSRGSRFYMSAVTVGRWLVSILRI